MSARTSLGPSARAVLRAGIDGSKRRKLAALIGVYADVGRCDPSITELAERSGLPRRAVVDLLDALEAEGHLSIERGDYERPRGTRSRYRLTVPGAPAPPTNPKENTTMTTDTITVTAAPKAVPAAGLLPAERPVWATAGWLPELESIDWATLTDARSEHVAAVAALEKATGTDEEAARLLDLCAVAERAILTIVADWDSALAALDRISAEAEAAKPESGNTRPGVVPLSDDHPFWEEMRQWSGAVSPQLQAAKRDLLQRLEPLRITGLMGIGIAAARERAAAVAEG